VEVGGGGTIALPQSSAETSGEVLVAVRPERTALSRQPPAEATHLAVPCTVTEVLFLGPTREVHVAYQNGRRGLVELSNLGGAPAFSPGENAWLSAPPEACRTLSP
jgi:hypothetical protein